MIPLPDCALELADAYAVPVEIVQAVRHVESGGRQSVGRVCNNKNGTCDIGAMQINEWWLPRLHKQNIDGNLLEHNECVNIAVGVWILSSNFYHYGNWQSALSAYNTGKPDSEIGKRYASKVLARIKSTSFEN